MPSVSIIIPTHNRVGFLSHAITSAHSAANDAEVIVVDDASNRETEDMCAGLSGIRYIRLEKNMGLSAARNVGIHASSAPFLSFLDDDDRRLPGSIDLQLEVLAANPRAALIYGPVLVADSRTLTSTGKIVPSSCPSGDVFSRLLSANFIYVPSVVARRDKVLEAGLFRSGVEGAEDWDLWIRMAENNEFAKVAEPVAIYRDWHGSTDQASSNRVNMCRMAARVQARGLRLPRARRWSRKERGNLRGPLMKGCCRELIGVAVNLVKTGAVISAIRALLVAFCLRPGTTLGALAELLLRAGDTSRGRRAFSENRSSVE